MQNEYSYTCYESCTSTVAFEVVDLVGATVRSLTDPEASREAQKDAAKHPFALEIVDLRKNHLFEADSTEDLMSPRRSHGGAFRVFSSVSVVLRMVRAFHLFCNYNSVMLPSGRAQHAQAPTRRPRLA